ncbi:MAG: hypothetical protein ACI9DC_003143 [Gammaproteobacteria bacterium]|jgi:hypothetical protein
MRCPQFRRASWAGVLVDFRMGLVAVLFLFSASALALSASVDRNAIEDGGIVQLTLEVEGRNGQRPDVTPLEKDFEVLGTASTTRMAVVNGRASSSTQWILNLRPKRVGTATIPVLESGGARSQAIEIRVGESRKSLGDTPDLFLETEVSSQSLYVQAQLTYTVRVFHAVALQSGQLSEPGSGSALTLKVGEDRSFAASRNGRRYRVIERKYAVFPQESGELTLEAPVLEGQVVDRNGNRRQLGGGFLNGYIGRTRPVRVRGEARTIQIRARAPAAQDHDQWLPAQSVELSGEWDSQQAEMNVGEPLTLIVKLTATGLVGTQLADVAPKQLDGFSVYPDNADVQTTFSDQGTARGTLTQKIAFIPRRAGELTVPDLIVRWWNTQTDREEVAVLPGITRSVLGAAPAQPVSNMPVPLSPQSESIRQVPANARDTSAADTPQPGMSTVTHIWIGVSALFALAWIITLALWWRARVRPESARDGEQRSGLPTSADARSQIEQACRRDDPLATRNALLAWGAAHWAQDPPRGLDQIAARISDPPLADALHALDRALYCDLSSDARQWKADELLSLLSGLPSVRSVVSSTPSRQRLPRHYAQSAVC